MTQWLIPSSNLPQTTSHPHSRHDTLPSSAADDKRPYAHIFRPTHYFAHAKMDHTATDARILNILRILEVAVGNMASDTAGIHLIAPKMSPISSGNGTELGYLNGNATRTRPSTKPTRPATKPMRPATKPTRPWRRPSVSIKKPKRVWRSWSR